MTDGELQLAVDEAVRRGLMMRLSVATPPPDEVTGQREPSPAVNVHVRPTGTWEPECVTPDCRAPLGYLARVGSYGEKTKCEDCRRTSVASRLAASGISDEEMGKLLDDLVPPSADPRNRTLGAKVVAQRDAEFQRYIACLRDIAALNSCRKIHPPFVFVYGNCGTGKSAAAERALHAAILNGSSGRVVSFSSLMRQIRSSYDRPLEEDPFTLYASTQILVVNEVGPDADTDHSLGVFFDLVDERLRAQRATIFTANYAPEDDSLGARVGSRSVESERTRVTALLDRLAGGTGNNTFCLLGPSWRRRP